MMKRITFKFMFAAVLLLVGTSGALGATSDVYKRAITADAANGVVAWSADDLGDAAWATTVSPASTSIDATLGLSLLAGGKQEISNTTQINPTANAKLTIDAVWYAGGFTGRNGNNTYLSIGNNIKFSTFPQDQKGYVTIGTTQTQVTNAVKKNVNRTDDTWNIHMVINTATMVISELTVTGTKGATKASLSLTDQQLPSTATFNSLTLGCVRGNYSVPPIKE